MEIHLADYEKVYLIVTKYQIIIICYEFIICIRNEVSMFTK